MTCVKLVALHFPVIRLDPFPEQGHIPHHRYSGIVLLHIRMYAPSDDQQPWLMTFWRTTVSMSSKVFQTMCMCGHLVIHTRQACPCGHQQICKIELYFTQMPLLLPQTYQKQKHTSIHNYACPRAFEEEFKWV